MEKGTAIEIIYAGIYFYICSSAVELTKQPASKTILFK